LLRRDPLRLLLTRPEPDAARTAAALRAAGHEVLTAPMLRIEPVAADLGAGPWEAVLITSANAARAVAAHPRRRDHFTRDKLTWLDQVHNDLGGLRWRGPDLEIYPARYECQFTRRPSIGLDAQLFLRPLLDRPASPGVVRAAADRAEERAQENTSTGEPLCRPRRK